MALWKRRNAVRDLVMNHMACVRMAICYFVDACEALFKDCNLERAHELAQETHRAEGNADNIRRQVARELVSGAMMPSSRRQVLELVEQVDSLANAAEAALDQLMTYNVSVPDRLAEAALEIVHETASIWDEVEDAIKALFAGNATETLNCANRIERAEARVDQIERCILMSTFDSSLELAQKLQIADLIKNLVTISDRAEDLSDRLALIVAERAY